MAEHVSLSDRVAAGKAARKLAPRRSHAGWEAAADRLDPITQLERQSESRVPDLVPIRYGRMLVSPFSFFRGAAAIMAADLATTPRSGFVAQLCGDAHLSNFGIFGTPERKFVFDINDFDETHVGPWEWDVKRLAASIAVAGRENAYSGTERATAVAATAHEYRIAMRTLAKERSLTVWYRHLEVDKLLARVRREFAKQRLVQVEADIAKARTKDSLRAFSKLTGLVDGERRILDDPPLVVSIEELLAGEDWREIDKEVRAMVRRYRRTLTLDRRDLLDQYRLVHLARKVVGVGSVGTRAWIVLFVGHDESDPLILQVKEAQESVLEQFTGPSKFRNHGQRIVTGQRRMQAAGDPFLGWTHIDLALDGKPHDYYVRQLWDWKGSATIEGMSPAGLARYGRTCAWTLARAHARSGDRIAIASYLGRGDAFDRALVSFGEEYADQNDRDYAALADAVASGRIVAHTGV